MDKGVGGLKASLEGGLEGVASKASASPQDEGVTMERSGMEGG